MQVLRVLTIAGHPEADPCHTRVAVASQGAEGGAVAGAGRHH